MGLGVIYGSGGNVIYDTVSNMAFGPVFDEEEEPEEFIEWVKKRYHAEGYRSTVDIRQIPDRKLEKLIAEWRREPVAETVKNGGN